MDESVDAPAVELTPEAASEVCLDVVERIEESVVVERRVLFETLSAVIARGHVLVEDVPGTGKTVLARVLAEALGLEFGRLQFTPDLLPSDVTGSNVYNEHDRAFEFAEGPVFTNVVLADEINRAPPKTQAALLEAMEEGQVSVDGTTHPLPEPFVVVATQNPVEQEGTFQLPEAQRDRFSVKTSLGYPSVEGEMGLLDRRANRRTIAPSVDPAVEPGTVQALQELAEGVRVDEKVRRYIIEIARKTREDGRVEVGVSPRGVQRAFEAARASAVISGREYVTPDDVKRLTEATMAHRLVLTTEATVEGVDPADVVQTATDAVDVPAVSPEAPEPDSETAPEASSVTEEPEDRAVDRRPAETEATSESSLIGEGASGNPSTGDDASGSDASRRDTTDTTGVDRDGSE
jgi:MoxR-like ATPase